MPKDTHLRVELVHFVPHALDANTLYISEEYQVAVHLCPCGCGNQVVTPIHGPIGWNYVNKGGLVTLHPSIGNWQIPCRSHYWIRENTIVWA